MLEMEKKRIRARVEELRRSAEYYRRVHQGEKTKGVDVAVET